MDLEVVLEEVAELEVVLEEEVVAALLHLVVPLLHLVVLLLHLVRLLLPLHLQFLLVQHPGQY